MVKVYQVLGAIVLWLQMTWLLVVPESESVIDVHKLAPAGFPPPAYAKLGEFICSATVEVAAVSESSGSLKIVSTSASTGAPTWPLGGPPPIMVGGVLSAVACATSGNIRPNPIDQAIVVREIKTVSVFCAIPLKTFLVIIRTKTLPFGLGLFIDPTRHAGVIQKNK
jgi:hypothetical protein